MQSRRLATLGISIFAALSFGVTACNVNSTPGGGTAAPTTAVPTAANSADAKETLVKATAELTKNSFKITMTAGPMNGSGAVDPVSGKGQMSMNVATGTQSMKMQFVLISNDMWLKIDGLPGLGDKWLHIDSSKLPEGSGFGFKPGELDPAGTAKLLSTVTSIEQTSPTEIKGTLDLTKASGTTVANKATIEQLGDKAKNIPFTATLDAQGRLTKMTVQMGDVSGIPVGVEVTYTDFGTPVTVTKPAPADVVEAPDVIYGLLGS